jgi:AraC-like DNA-binding protein
MVCDRCKWVVKTEIEKLGFKANIIDLGEVELESNINTDQKQQIKEALENFGFEVIDDKKSRTIEKIKTLIIDLVHQKNNELATNLSEYLSSHLSQDYSTLSNLFSEVEDVTIEKYFISQKIEKVKELLVYDELTVSEIAFQLNYSSAAYLSNQFKKVTGFTPLHYKQLKDKKRKQIEKV